MANLIEEEATVQQIKYHKGDWIIARVTGAKQFNSVVGSAPNGLVEGKTYLFEGKLEEPNKWGVALKFEHAAEAVPRTEVGVALYLEKLPGIGPVSAAAIVGTYGAEHAVDVLRNNPQDVSEQCKISIDVANSASEILKSSKERERAMIELLEIFNKSGIKKSVIGSLLKRYGSEAAERVRRDPFILCQFSGIGFKLADKLWKHLGLPLDDPSRQAHCALYHMQQEGSVWFDKRTVASWLSSDISEGYSLKKCLEYGKANLFSVRNGLVAIQHLADSEDRVAKSVCRLLTGGSYVLDRMPEDDEPEEDSSERSDSHEYEEEAVGDSEECPF